MTELSMAIYNTKRLLRHKGLSAILLAVPLVAALIRVILSQNDWILFPLGCLVLVSAVLLVQWMMDEKFGLIDGLHSCLGFRRRVVVSRIVSGVTIFAAQMFIYCLVLAIRF